MEHGTIHELPLSVEKDDKMVAFKNTSLAVKGALTQFLQHQKNPKWLLGGPKIEDGVLKSVYPQGFGRSNQLSLFSVLPYI